MKRRSRRYDPTSSFSPDFGPNTSTQNASARQSSSLSGLVCTGLSSSAPYHFGLNPLSCCYLGLTKPAAPIRFLIDYWVSTERRSNLIDG